MVILDYKGIAPQKLEKIIRMVILREISSLELPEIKEEDQCHKVYQHSEIINKIKCAKFQIFWTLTTHTFQLAKSAPKCHFLTWDLLNLLNLHNFLTQVLDFDSCRPALWISFFPQMQVIIKQKLLLHWEILIMLLPQFPLTFCQT